MSDRPTNNQTTQGIGEDVDTSLSVVSEEDQSLSGQLSENEIGEMNRAAEEQLAIDALEASARRLDQVVRPAQAEQVAIDALEASARRLDQVVRPAQAGQVAIDALEASARRLDQVVRPAQAEQVARDELEASARRLDQVVRSAPEGRASTSQGTGTERVLMRDMLENANQLPQTQPGMEPIVDSTMATLNELRSLLDPIPTPSVSIANETLMANSQYSPTEPQENPSWVESLEESRNERSSSSERER